MVAKLCSRSHGQPEPGVRSAAMMSIRAEMSREGFFMAASYQTNQAGATPGAMAHTEKREAELRWSEPAREGSRARQRPVASPDISQYDMDSIAMSEFGHLSHAHPGVRFQRRGVVAADEQNASAARQFTPQR